MSPPSPHQPHYVKLVLDQNHPLSKLKRVAMTFDVTVPVDELVVAFRGLLVAAQHPYDLVDDLVPDPDEWIDLDETDGNDEDEGNGGLTIENRRGG